MPDYPCFGKNLRNKTKIAILTTMDQLHSCRQKIDEIDIEIISLFAKRFTLVQEIGKLKKAQNIPTRDNKREEEKLNMIVQLGQEKGISKEFITKIWNEIFTESYKLEK